MKRFVGILALALVTVTGTNATAQKKTVATKGDVKAVLDALNDLKKVVKDGNAELKTEIGKVATGLEGVKTEVAGLRTEVGLVKEDVKVLRTDVTALKSDVTAIKSDVAAVRTEVAAVKADVSGLRGDVGSLATKQAEHIAEVRKAMDRPQRTEITFHVSAPPVQPVVNNWWWVEPSSTYVYPTTYYPPYVPTYYYPTYPVYYPTYTYPSYSSYISSSVSTRRFHSSSFSAIWR